VLVDLDVVIDPDAAFAGFVFYGGVAAMTVSDNLWSGRAIVARGEKETWAPAGKRSNGRACVCAGFVDDLA
jgi:hypothetical protein